MACRWWQIIEHEGVVLKMTSLLSGGVGTGVCVAILAQKGSGKSFYPGGEDPLIDFLPLFSVEKFPITRCWEFN